MTLALGLAVALGLATSVRAQQDGDLALLSGGQGVPPNVMLLFDVSGSMQHTVWEDGFDPALFHDDSDTNQCRYSSGSSWPFLRNPVLPGSSGSCPGSGDPNDGCPNNASSRASRGGSEQLVICPLSLFSRPCGGFTGSECWTSSSWLVLELPDFDPASARETWWSWNYLHYWIADLIANGGAAVPIPRKTRFMGGQEAMKKLIDETNPDLATGGYEENVRFGLSILDFDQGGYVKVEVGPNNKTTLLNTIDNLEMNWWTPLSEALVDVGRYFTGQHDNLGSYGPYDRSAVDGSAPATPLVSPIDPSLTCQENFVVLVTDGEPTQDLNNHHGAAFTSTFANGGDVDGDGNDVPPQTSNCFGGGSPHCTSDYLDDVAKQLHDEDLIDDAVMAGKQNVSTYTVGFAIDLPLLQEAATNGGGKYFTTSNADMLASQLKEAVQEIIERTTTFTAASVPSSRTAFGNGFFVAFFEPKESEALWPGHIEAYKIADNFEILGENDQVAVDPVTGEFATDPRIPIWDAGHKLAGTNGEPPHPPRSLYTAQSRVRVDFTSTSMTAADLGIQSSDLSIYPAPAPFGSTEALADAIVQYVHGEDAFDADRDGDPSEIREAVLGDIFHSNPVVVGTPPTFLLGEDGFGPPDDATSFFARYALRDRKLYVGANDGVLHGFNAGVIGVDASGNATYDLEEPGDTGGQEAFGYVPSFLLQKLKKIPLQTFNDRSFFVDGSPSVADAWLSSGPADASKETDEWTTAVVTGMRRGGDGYVALDVTDPTATGGAHGPYPRLLWEFDDPSEPLGETWSRPVLARVRLEAGPGGDFCDTGQSPAPSCREHWVAIFAGGYRPTGDGGLAAFAGPGDAGWTADSKAIFMVSLETGRVLAKVEYAAGDPELSRMIYSMPSNPAVLDIDFDGFVDLIFVGDTGGQLWKWDVSEIGVPDASDVVHTWDDDAGVFFETPIASNGHRRPIFFPPSASFIDETLTLAFGTGERTDLGYQSGSGGVDDHNRFYVIHDPSPKGIGSIPATPHTEADLTQLNGLQQDPDPTDLGFYLVADANEKFVTNHLAFAGFLITASYRPDGAAVSDPCAATGGSAFLYVFELGTGEGFFPDVSSAGADATRRLALGGGVPTDPRITTSGTSSGQGTSHVFVQTSGGTLKDAAEFDENIEPVEIIFWRQQL